MEKNLKKKNKMTAFFQENGIKQSHGFPHTPANQGLVDRANESWKEDMWTLILSESFKVMYMYTTEAVYVRNMQ